LYYYNRRPQTRKLVKNRDLFLTVLKSGKSKLEGSYLVRAFLLRHPRAAKQKGTRAPERKRKPNSHL
jgi:hypothetical protein